MMFWSYYFPHFLLVHVLIAWSCAKAKTKSKTKPKPRHSGRYKALVYLIIFFSSGFMNRLWVSAWTGYHQSSLDKFQMLNQDWKLKEDFEFVWILYITRTNHPLLAHQQMNFHPSGKREIRIFLKDLLIIKCTFFHLM